MKKDVLIGAVDLYNVDQVIMWAKSARDVGFTGDIVLLAYRINHTDFLQKLEPYRVTLVDTDNTDNFNKQINHNDKSRNTQAHQMRFFHVWRYLMTEDYDVAIITDVRDVVFQRNPSEAYREVMQQYPGYTIMAPSEAVTYANEQWGLENIYYGFGQFVTIALKDTVIANVGTIAGTASDMRDLALTIFSMGEGRYIPNDQSSFNVLRNTSLKDKIMLIPMSDAWAVQCGTTLDQTKPTVLQHNVEPAPTVHPDFPFVRNASGKPFALVHQYERVPTLEQKYRGHYEC